MKMVFTWGVGWVGLLFFHLKNKKRDVCVCVCVCGGGGGGGGPRKNLLCDGVLMFSATKYLRIILLEENSKKD